MSGGTHAARPRAPGCFGLRGSHPLRRPVPAAFGQHPARARGDCRPPRRARPTPARQRRQPPGAARVWAPPRSLAATGGILSSPRGTEMFQFPRCPPARAGARPSAGRVAPFGHPQIAGRQRLPGAFRRVAASFVGRRRQGIHRAPISAATPRRRRPARPERGSGGRTGARPRDRGPTIERHPSPDARPRATPRRRRGAPSRGTRGPRLVLGSPRPPPEGGGRGGKVRSGSEKWCAARGRGSASLRTSAAAGSRRPRASGCQRAKHPRAEDPGMIPRPA